MTCAQVVETSVTCFFSFIEVDGGYSAWSMWSMCSATCGEGVKLRSRICNSPSPRKGGKNCASLGSNYETMTCNEAVCPIGTKHVKKKFNIIYIRYLVSIWYIPHASYSDPSNFYWNVLVEFFGKLSTLLWRDQVIWLRIGVDSSSNLKRFQSSCKWIVGENNSKGIVSRWESSFVNYFQVGSENSS